MIVNQFKKLENAVAFFAREYQKHYGFWPAQMWIYKLLALLDFRILKISGMPCIGIEYTAMKNGPVPNALYFDRFNGITSDVFQLVPAGGRRFNVVALQEPDLDYFSDMAIDEMENLVNEFIKSGRNLHYLINETHKLRSWKVAFDSAQKIGRVSLPMEYADEFEDDLMTKNSDKLTFQEARFIEFETHKRSMTEESESADECR